MNTITKQRTAILKLLENNLIVEKENNNDIIISNISFFKIDYKEKNNALQVLQILKLFYGIDVAYIALTKYYKIVLVMYHEATTQNRNRVLCSFLFMFNKTFNIKK